MTMRALVCALGLAWLVACGENTIHRPATQVTVRVRGSVAVQSDAMRLRVQVAPRSGDTFAPRKAVDVVLAGLAWPIDLPIVPGDGQSADGQFEVVVDALDAGGSALAQARAITNFVKEKQQLLTLTLAACGDVAVCQVESCHGPSCLACDDGQCTAQPVIPGESLPPLDASEDPINGVDGGGGNDGGQDGGDAGAGCEEGDKRCQDDRSEVCRGGSYVLDDECTAACFEGECTGVCKPTTVSCGGDANLTPMICDERGTWQPNPAVNGGAACEFLCTDGGCAGDCEPGTRRCVDNQSQECQGGAWVDDTLCADLCKEGACANASSCGGALSCAPQRSCCESHVVPGGTFQRSYDASGAGDVGYSATLHAFRIDRYEVTVGRFRRFLQAYEATGKPSAMAGKNQHNGADVGWRAEWSALLPETASAFRERLSGCAETTWRDGESENNSLPINCITWYEALAFCIWDGGRLPTEAEWNYAAAGGDEQRVFPWSVPATQDTYDDTYLVIEPEPIQPVGSKPAGESRWFSLDVSGNVAEFVQDWYLDPYPTETCVDCASLDSGEGKVVRGGSYRASDPSVFGTISRTIAAPELPSGKVGVRCVRDLD